MFAEGKFISTLAFLFGLGFTFQGMRAEARERSATWLLVRRIAVLGLFGLAHAVLIWSGDILLTYALMALVLLLFRRRDPRTLLTWAGGILGAWVLLLVAFAAVAGPALAAGAGAALPATEGFFEQARAAYTSGSYAQMTAQRLRELVFVMPFGLFLVSWFVFPMMLAGAAVARAGWLADLEAHRPALRRAAVIGLGTGILLNIAYAALAAIDPGGLSPLFFAGQACWSVGAPALSIGYMASVTLFALSRPGSAIVARLAAVGRLALTNYLTQSIVMTAIFYGLGLYGRIGLVPSLAIALALLTVRKTLQHPREARDSRSLAYGPVSHTIEAYPASRVRRVRRLGEAARRGHEQRRACRGRGRCAGARRGSCPPAGKGGLSRARRPARRRRPRTRRSRRGPSRGYTTR